MTAYVIAHSVMFHSKVMSTTWLHYNPSQYSQNKANTALFIWHLSTIGKRHLLQMVG